jgi:hypothetical protein
MLRTICGGLGTVALLAATGWPSGLMAAVLALVGAAAGVLLAFCAERALDRNAEITALETRVAELQGQLDAQAQARKLLDYELPASRREAAINAAFVEVSGGAYREIVGGGPILPWRR